MLLTIKPSLIGVLIASRICLHVTAMIVFHRKTARSNRHCIQKINSASARFGWIVCRLPLRKSIQSDVNKDLQMQKDAVPCGIVYLPISCHEAHGRGVRCCCIVLFTAGSHGLLRSTVFYSVYFD